MKIKTTIYGIVMITCLCMFGLAKANNSSGEFARQSEADLFRPITLYHNFTVYDQDCGWMTYDGFTTWDDNNICTGYCIDVSTDNCGDMHFEGISPPDEMLDNGTVTEVSLVRYTKIKYGN